MGVGKVIAGLRGLRGLKGLKSLEGLGSLGVTNKPPDVSLITTGSCAKENLAAGTQWRKEVKRNAFNLRVIVPL